MVCLAVAATLYESRLPDSLVIPQPSPTQGQVIEVKCVPHDLQSHDLQSHDLQSHDLQSHDLQSWAYDRACHALPLYVLWVPTLETSLWL
jgi:hypothetical protein